AGSRGPDFGGYPSSGPEGRGHGGRGCHPSSPCAAVPVTRRQGRGPGPGGAASIHLGISGGRALQQARAREGSTSDAPCPQRDPRRAARLAPHPPPCRHGDAVAPRRARPPEPAERPGRGVGSSPVGPRWGAARRGRAPGPAPGQQLPQHGEPRRPGGHPQGAALLRSFLPAAGPDRGGHDRCLARSVQGRHRLAGRPAVQRASPLHGHRPDLPAGRCPAGLPCLQERDQTHNQSPARAATRLRVHHRPGLVAVFDYHRKKGYADLYSLHSWCGILAFVLYFVQWLVGFGFFLFPGASFSLRSRYRPQHIFFGATIFLLAVGTALLGLKEALLFKLGTKYSTFEPEGILANTLGLLLAGFGVTVLYILTRADWKRPPQAEEQALSMDFKTLTEGDSPSSQ
uniref:Transmembrane ascorbate-dependent reductase CYB561 n=1 Tax=Felis catus TaxID=9685 RepID=A0ABI7Z296_FELCA